MPRPEPYVQKYSEDVDIVPWKLAAPVGVSVIVLIAIMYVGFAGEFGHVEGAKVKAEFEQLHPPDAEPSAEQGLEEAQAEK